MSVEKMNTKIIQPPKEEIVKPQKMGLLVENPVYKPFRYPWCYDAWLTQQRIHWLPEEVPLGDDVRDWQKNLTQSEKNLLTQIFRFFTQADVEVQNCYLRHYTTVFKPTEVLMMMTAFASMETVHIAAYSHLLDTIGMPESEYSAFMKYKEMKDKYDYMQNFDMSSKKDIALTVAVFSAFTEGLQLFESFNKRIWSNKVFSYFVIALIIGFTVLLKQVPEIYYKYLLNPILLLISIMIIMVITIYNFQLGLILTISLITLYYPAKYYYKNDPYTIWKDLWINPKSKIYTNHYQRCTNVFLKNMEKFFFKNIIILFFLSLLLKFLQAC